MLMDLLQHRWRTQKRQRQLGTKSWQSCPSPRQVLLSRAAEPMRTEHVRSFLAPAGLAVQTSTFNAMDSSDPGNATTNLSAKTAHGYYGRLVTLVAFTIAHPYNPIIVRRRPAFSNSPSRDGPVETKVVRSALTVATTAPLQASSPRRVWGGRGGFCGNGHLTIGNAASEQCHQRGEAKDARTVMEGRGRVRVKSSRS